MKTKVLMLVTMLLSVFAFSTYAQEKKNDKKETVLFDVSMTCENCKKKIEKNIAFEKGVTDMKVDLPSKTVKVTYRTDKTDEEKLIKALEKLGYKVSVHQEDETKSQEK